MFVFLQCGNLSNLPVETLYERALDWIRQNPHTERLQSRFRLNYYFPTGPAPEEDMMIDIIAVTGSSTYSGIHPLTMFDPFITSFGKR